MTESSKAFSGSNIEHFFNEKAADVLRNRASCFKVLVPENLTGWISKVEFYRGYFIGPREPRESTDRQIADAVERLDDFSVEMFLNKVHLEDDTPDNFPPADYVLIYFAVCDYFARYLLQHGVKKPMLLGYSTDAFETDAEYPSHTINFGFPRSDKDYYHLDVDDFGHDAVIWTLITVVS